MVYQSQTIKRWVSQEALDFKHGIDWSDCVHLFWGFDQIENTFWDSVFVDSAVFSAI